MFPPTMFSRGWGAASTPGAWPRKRTPRSLARGRARRGSAWGPTRGEARNRGPTRGEALGSGQVPLAGVARDSAGPRPGVDPEDRLGRLLRRRQLERNLIGRLVVLLVGAAPFGRGPPPGVSNGPWGAACGFCGAHPEFGCRHQRASPTGRSGLRIRRPTARSRPRGLAPRPTSRCTGEIKHGRGFGFTVLASPDPAEQTKMLAAELANGRLAVMAITGVLFQDGPNSSAWGDWALHTASPLRAFENELGVQAPVGFFHLAGFAADGAAENFACGRQTEIKHGRIAMFRAMESPCIADAAGDFGFKVLTSSDPAETTKTLDDQRNGHDNEHQSHGDEHDLHRNRRDYRDNHDHEHDSRGNEHQRRDDGSRMPGEDRAPTTVQVTSEEEIFFPLSPCRRRLQREGDLALFCPLS